LLTDGNEQKARAPAGPAIGRLFDDLKAEGIDPDWFADPFVEW
jgi:hypothetical protein